MKKLTPFLFIVAAAFMGGGVSTLSKIASAEIPPITFTLLRFMLGALTLLPFFIIFREKITKIDRKSIIAISLLAALNPFLFFIGVKHTTAIMGQMVYTALPLITIIFSYWMGEETITRKKILGVLIGLIGALIIVVHPAIENGTNLTNSSMIGNIIILCAAISFSLYTVLIRKHQKDHSPLELNMYFMLTTITAQLFLLPIDLATAPAWWQTITNSGILGLLYVGIIGTGIYYLLIQYALKTSSPLAASTILYLQPLFTIIWAGILLGEKLTSSLILGGILAFIGIGLVMSRQKARQ